MRFKHLLGGVAAVALTLSAAACSNSLGGAPAQSSQPSVKSDKALFDKLPDKIKQQVAKRVN